jgi:hypothetical protein
MTAGNITKVCVAGVLFGASSQAAAPDGAVVVRQPSIATATQIEALESYNILSLKRVYFSAGHSRLSRSERATLEQIASAVSGSVSIIELRGYAMERDHRRRMSR